MNTAEVYFQTTSGNRCKAEVAVAIVENEMRIGVHVAWERKESAADTKEFDQWFMGQLNALGIEDTTLQTVRSSDAKSSARRVASFLQFGDWRVGGQG